MTQMMIRAFRVCSLPGKQGSRAAVQDGDTDFANRIALGGECHKIGKMHTYAYVLYVFAYIFDMFSASPSPIMESAFGRLHNGGWADFGHPPTVVESIMGDGEAANIANT